MSFQSIRVVKVSKNRYCLSIIWGGKRYRFYNGAVIGSESRPQSLPTSMRLGALFKLRTDFQRAIELGWTPFDNWSALKKPGNKKPENMLFEAIDAKMMQGVSDAYLKKLKWIVNNLHKYLNGRIPNPDLLCEFISDGNWSPATSNNIRRHLIALEKELQVYGYKGSIKSKIKKYRVTEQLHKPFKDVNLVFEEILSFDSRLYLCCLLAYGCLLRPHREIRLLKWEDFADDLSWVSLSGKMTKSKKNRVVPVPGYIKRILENYKTCHSQPCHNIFSGTSEPYNQYYFTTLWGRYKSKSMVLEGNQTLYSFRHTGAINVFQKTGSLTKLQYIMGHSTLQVSLTYLRFLEINKIDPKDMPDLNI